MNPPGTKPPWGPTIIQLRDGIHTPDERFRHCLVLYCSGNCITITVHVRFALATGLGITP